MKLVTVEQMRALDRLTIEKYGIPSLTLMERAGRGVADVVHRFYPVAAGPVGILVGKGNNGGDGLVAARSLRQWGYEVYLFHTSTASEMSEDARTNWERMLPLGVKTFSLERAGSLETNTFELKHCSCLVDALVGTGLSAPLADFLRLLVEKVNQLGIPLIAIDIPSGLSGDSGAVLGATINATHTVTLGLPKVGLCIGEGPRQAGRIHVVDIGIPAEEMACVSSALELITPQLFSHILLPRKQDAHKGNFGHVLLFAGSDGKLGAGYLASLAALRVGAGLVSYALPQAAFDKFDARYPEIMCQPIPDDGTAHFHPIGEKKTHTLLEGKNVVAVGPAIGTDPDTLEYVTWLVGETATPLVIDADALNCLVGCGDLLRGRSAATIVTPHPGEMGRQIGRSSLEVQKDRLAIALDFAQANHVIVVLKGDHTIVATPQGRAFINQTGNPGMATAGTGDVLTGVIAGFLAQGHDPLSSAMAGVYLHGAAGDIATLACTEAGMIASDVIQALPQAIRQAVKDCCQ